MVVLDAQAALFLDDFHLAQELVLRQGQAVHALGFEFQGDGQLVAAEDLVIGGVVAAGEGVFLGTEAAQQARGLAGRQALAALEHHVLQGVGHAGPSGWFVAAADPVPELRNHHGRTVIFPHDDF